MLEARCMQCCVQDQISPSKSPRSPNSPLIRRQFTNWRQKEASDTSTALAISALPLMGIVDWSWRDTVMRTGEQGRIGSQFLDTFSLLQAAQSHGHQRNKRRRHCQPRKRNISLWFKQ